jgi:Flp pilus assembly protein TadG
MSRSFISVLSCRGFVKDRRGAIALLYALAAVPTVAAIGVAVDYARLESFKTSLQNVADAAALAGASAYVDNTQNAAAQTVAQEFITSNTSQLPSALGTPSTTVSASPLTVKGQAGYSVTVTASATVKNTLMQAFTGSSAISVTATAVNPVIQFTASVGNWTSSAWDANTVWWYIVPKDNSVPNPANFASNQKMFSNTSSTNPNVTFSLTASQKIGFALQNVTGGRGGNYGSTQYGAPYMSNQWFFSNAWPPSNNTYDKYNYPGVSQDCNLQTSITGTQPTSTTPPTSGSCMTTQPKDASLSCGQANGQYVNYYWNDMGGNPDDKDYNDAEYSFSCAGAGAGNGNATVVYLYR